MGRELFIVEGVSASNAVLNVVDRTVQDVFAVQGKPINVARASASAIRRNERAAALGHHLIGPHGDGSSPLPYDRIVLLTDGDPDGVHAKALLLLLIHHQAPDLVARGELFIVRAPLFGVTCDQRPAAVFAYSAEGRDRVVDQLHQRGATDVQAHHYKGLAGMDRGDLWRLCVSPEERRLSPLTLEHVRAAHAALR